MNAYATWGLRNRKHFEDLGYLFTKYGDSFQIDAQHAMNNSDFMVSVVCPICNTEHTIPHRRAARNSYKNIICDECSKVFRTVRHSDSTVSYIYAPYRDKTWLYNEYIVKNRPAREISEECKVNPRSIWDWIWKHDLPSKEVISDTLPIDDIKSLYLDSGLSSQDIADRYGASSGTILTLLKNNGVEIPSFTDLRKRYLWEKGGREKITEYSRNEENRIHNSCKQRNISIDEFNGFTQSKNMAARKNCDYEVWRKSIFERDNYTCQACGRRARAGEKVVLNAHHIENFSVNENLRYDIDNGMTLCDRCHSFKFKTSFHAIYGARNNTREQLDEYIRNRRAELSA